MQTNWVDALTSLHPAYHILSRALFSSLGAHDWVKLPCKFAGEPRSLNDCKSISEDLKQTPYLSAAEEEHNSQLRIMKQMHICEDQGMNTDVRVLRQVIGAVVSALLLVPVCGLGCCLTSDEHCLETGSE